MSNDIIHAITRLFWAVDHHDWDALPHVLGEEVLLAAVFALPQAARNRGRVARAAPYRSAL